MNSAPQLTAPVAQTIDELTPLLASASASDPDLPANVLSYRMIAGPEGATVHPQTGVLSWTPGEGQGPSTNSLVVVATDDGTPPLSVTNQFAVVVREVNQVPAFQPVAPQETADERVFRLVVAATDPDLPSQALRYALGEGAPEGARVDPATGELSWAVGYRTVRETVIIPLRVTDDGLPPLSAEVQLSVTVVPPVLRLARLDDQAVAEGQLLTLTAAVADSPQAVPPFSYALTGSVPEGASLNPSTGILFWRPSEAQGPSTNLLTLRVTDSAVTPHVHERSITVAVAEVNQAPALAAIAPQEAAPGGLLEIQPAATDDDLPPNRLTFLLSEDAPEGLTIHPETGVIRWTPGPAFAGTTNRFTVRVTDDGQPVLEASRVVRVAVAAAVETRLAAEWDGAAALRLVLHSDVGRTYLIESSGNLTSWEMLTNFVTAATRTDIPVPPSTSDQPRFYRAIAP
ncbi:MAG: cadherin repeat domain-containing protein [Verrucomicrobia bacterium]|nr:cadherin repeat domain-containing protein [Verrucomicrobiota bacterium]